MKKTAAEVLATILRCATPDITQENKAKFMEWAEEKLPPKSQIENFKSGVQLRLSGVLALGAMVLSCSYTIPDWLPDILDLLARRSNDPYPIAV